MEAKSRFMKLLVFITLFFSLFIGSCSDSGSSEDDPTTTPALTPSEDQDGDGLTNGQELTYGTNPYVADTDGDGYSDADEIINKGFNPTSDPFKFNPNVADIPQIKITLSSPPKLTIDHQSSSTSQSTLQTGQSSSTASTITTGETSTESQAVETTVSKQSWGGSVLGKKLPAKVGNVTQKTSTTEETSFSWSKQQAEENRMTYENSLAVSQESGFVYNGGEIAITVNVENTGHIAFTLTNPVLSVTQLQPNTEGLMTPIGNLNYDTATLNFQETLGPGDASSPWIFKNAEITLTDIQNLLKDSHGMIIGTSSYDLINENNISFNHQLTDIRAKTATIVIDYGPDIAYSREYRMVATTQDPSNPGITMRSVMEDKFHLPYVNDNGLTAIRDVAEDASLRKAWTVVHHYKEGGLETDSVYSKIDIENYDFDAIKLQAGDTVLLIYRDDSDMDGLGKREEIMLGTDRFDPDTDGDNIADGNEVFSETDPLDATQVILDASSDSAANAVVTNGAIFYVVGYGTNLVSATSDKDWLIKKYDNHGKEIVTGWNKQFDGNGGDDVAQAVQLDNLGNLYVAGYGYDIATYSYATTTSGVSKKDWWIKKFNSSGTQLWDVKLDGKMDEDEATSLAIGDDGYVYVTGYASNLFNASSSGRDWMIHKIKASDGGPVSRQSFPGYYSSEFSQWPITYNDASSDNQTPQSIIYLRGEDFAPLLVNDRIVIGGWDEVGSNFFGKPIDWRIKAYSLDPDSFHFNTENTGNWDITRSVGSTRVNQLYAMLYDDGSFYAAGLADKSAGMLVSPVDGPEAQYHGDWSIRQFNAFNANEDTTWNLQLDSNNYTTIDRNDTDIAYAMTSDSSSIWVAGSGNNFKSSVTAKWKNTDWWIKRFSKADGSEMTLNWKNTHDGFGEFDEAKGIAINNSGTLMVVGYVTNTVKQWCVRKVYTNTIVFVP